MRRRSSAKKNPSNRPPSPRPLSPPASAPAPAAAAAAPFEEPPFPKSLSQARKRAASATSTADHTASRTTNPPEASEPEPKRRRLSLLKDQQPDDPEHDSDLPHDFPFHFSPPRFPLPPFPMEDDDPRAMHLQSLLRRLGSGLEDGPGPQPGNPMLRSILAGLRAEGREDKQYEALFELSNMLAMATEDTMGGFSVEQFLPPLLSFLHYEHNPEMMLLSVRSLCHLMEAQPNSVMAIVQHDSVPLIVEKLLNIEYIDLAEQSLIAIEKISHEAPQAVLKAGGLMAVLSYIDFFPMSVQRIAAAVAANVCFQVPSNCNHFIPDAAPLLLNLLQTSDAKLLENIAVAFSRLTESVGGNETLLRTVAGQGLIPRLLQMLSPQSQTSSSSSPLSPAAYIALLRTLSRVCEGSASLSQEALEQGVCGLLSAILTANLQADATGQGVVSPISKRTEKTATTSSGKGSPLPATAPASALSLVRSVEVLFEALCLANVLLPPVVSDSSLPSLPSPSMPRSTAGPSRRTRGPFGGREGPPERSHGSSDATNKERLATFKKQPLLFTTMAEALFGPVTQVYLASLHPAIKHRALSILSKLVEHCPAPVLRTSLRDLGISSFLASLIASRDWSAVVPALLMATVLMTKLSDIFEIYFRREGVVHEIDKLIKETPEETPESAPPSREQQRSERSPMLRRTQPPPEDFDPQLPPGLQHLPPELAALLAPNHPLAMMSPPASQQQSPRIAEARAWCVQKARELQSKHFSKTLSDAVAQGTSRVLTELSGFATALRASKNLEAEEKLLAQILALIASEDGVSPFELLESGIVETLLSYLSFTPEATPAAAAGAGKSAPAPKTSMSSHAGRLSAIVRVLDSRQAEFSVFVKKLLELLAKTEKFPVQLTDASGSRAGLRALGQPLRLVLKRHDSESGLKTFQSGPVMIEPMAPISAIENFLWGRVADDQTSPHTPGRSGLFDERSEALEDPDGDGDQDADGADGDREGEEDVVDVVPDAGGRSPLVQPTSSRLSASRTTSSGGSLPGSSGRRRELKDDEKPWKLAFELNGVVLDHSQSIFQVLARTAAAEMQQDTDQGALISRIWAQIAVITYRRWAGAKDAAAVASAWKMGNSNSTRAAAAMSSADDVFQNHIVATLSHPTPTSLDTTTAQILNLLRLLSEINSTAHMLSRRAAGTPAMGATMINPTEFCSGKISAKMIRQMQDPLTLCAANFPTWCTELGQLYPCVLPFETRRTLFMSLSFGIARSLHRLQQRFQEMGINPNEIRIGRIPRQKVRIRRNQMFEAALKVMEDFGANRSLLEVEYHGEVGTGLGPTLEFYSLVSREFRKRALGLWLDDSANGSSARALPSAPDAMPTKMSNTANTSKGVKTPASAPGTQPVTAAPTSPFVQLAAGLFPRPYHATSPLLPAVCNDFAALGRFVAKALLDGRILDLPLSRPFAKLLLGKQLTVFDIKDVDPGLGRAVEALHGAAVAKHAILANGALTAKQKQEGISLIRVFGNSTVESLSLVFALPGLPDYPLIPNGQNVDVTIANVDEYVAAVGAALFGEGVQQQISAFFQGFSKVFDPANLQCFSPDELDVVFNGAAEQWDRDTLLEHTKCDHGYTHESRPVRFLFDVLCEMTPEEQREFVMFVTGSPKLPVGGLAGLHPKLTIVKKTDDNSDVDKVLPSVSTCFYYVKLPNYSTKEILREKLFFAMREGQGNFNLS